jgi:Spy/CpxP family protein refolding chaperone
MSKVCNTLSRRSESARRPPTIRHLLWVAVLLLTTAAGCTSIQPSPPFEGEPLGRPAPLEQLPLITLMLWHAQDLSLTPVQIQTLDRLRSDFQRQVESQAAELQRMELELQQLFSREPIDLVQVESRMRKMEGLRTDLRMSRIRAIEQAKAVLTREQWSRLQPLLRGGL